MLNLPAPQFVLEATTGSTVSLSDLRGKYVTLVFYPANNTPVCNAQLTDINDELGEFAKNGLLVFGVNTSSVSAHKGYCLKRQLQFPILSDPGGKVARSFGAAFPFLSLIRRTVVVIDPEGIIRFYRRGNPRSKDILAAIAVDRERVAS